VTQKRDAPDAPTARVVTRDAPQGLFLTILGQEQYAAHPLPDSGEVVIGRSDRCDVCVPDASMSRQHARLRIGPVLTVEDLGSSNGVVVRDQRLASGASVEVTTNEIITLGSVSLVIQQRASRIRVRRIWGHDYFEGRLAEECARAGRAGASFAVVRLRFSEAPPTRAVQNVFAEVLRDVDVSALHSPAEYELLLADAGPDEADLVVRQLRSLVGDEDVVSMGAACFPGDGRTADALLAAASAETVPADEADSMPIVEDVAMKNLYALARRVAVGDINVLVLGETGAGKQVLAEAIHRFSQRSDKAFLELNCSAFSETLLESELFGHEKGAFTGATSSKPGLLEAANGGTVFLDEIGDMPLLMQAKLLRVIESRQVLRVGSLKPRDIDVRFVSATNRELEADVMSGRFRQDLFFRINGVTLSLPPLRERTREVESLSALFVKQYCGRLGRPPLTISDEAMQLLTGYDWPGNIRELRNVIERATLLATGSVIAPEHLPVQKMQATYAASVSPTIAQKSWGYRSAPPAVVGAEPATGPTSVAPAPPNGDDKRQRIVDAMARTGGNQTEAAKLLGVSRRTLGTWLERYDLPRPRKRKK